MKPLVITKEYKESVLAKVAAQLKKDWAAFVENVNDTKFSFSVDLTESAKEKVNIIFTPKAYLRMKALVNSFDTEVGWYGLIEKPAPKTYRIYDVKVCKQSVDGVKVDTDDDDVLEFFNNLTDDEAEHLHYQAHSHVRMGTEASTIDLQNQADVVKNMSQKGFYLFQIWNKQGDISTYLYDFDDNAFYDEKDVVINIEDEEGLLTDFVDSIKDLVKEKKTYPYQYYGNGYYGAGYNTKKKKEEKEKGQLVNLMEKAINEGWYEETWGYM